MPISLGTVASIILLVMGGILGYYFVQWGNAITQGVQIAAPGIGAMINAFGMIFAMMPAMMMMLMMMMFMNMFIGMFRT